MPELVTNFYQTTGTDNITEQTEVICAELMSCTARGQDVRLWVLFTTCINKFEEYRMHTHVQSEYKISPLDPQFKPVVVPDLCNSLNSFQSARNDRTCTKLKYMFKQHQRQRLMKQRICFSTACYKREINLCVHVAIVASKTSEYCI